MKTEDMCQINVIYDQYIGRPHGDSRGWLHPLDAMAGSVIRAGLRKATPAGERYKWKSIQYVQETAR